MNLKHKTLIKVKKLNSCGWHMSLQKALAKSTAEARWLGGFRAGQGFDTK